MSFTAPCFSGLLFLGCINALAYNLIHSLVIKITSAVTTTVIGEMKIVLILVLSAVVLGEGEMAVVVLGEGKGLSSVGLVRRWGELDC